LPASSPTRSRGCARVRLRVGDPQLQQHDGADDFDDAPEVSLLDPGSGRVLPCFMAASLEYEGETYAALYPVNAPIQLAEESAGRLVPIEDDLETPELLAEAAKACAARNIELLETPVVLTASGPGLEFVDDESMRSLEYADDEGDDDESEEALVLAELRHGGKTLMVVQTLDPLYVVGKRLEESRYVVPADAEIDAVQDTIEELVIEFEEGFDEDDDDFEDLDDDAFAP